MTDRTKNRAMHNFGALTTRSCLLWLFMFMGITSAALDVPSLNSFLDKQGLSGLNDYYDRGDREIERIRCLLSKSASQLCAKTESTVKEMIRSAPIVCNRLVRTIPTEIPGTTNLMRRPHFLKITFLYVWKICPTWTVFNAVG